MLRDVPWTSKNMAVGPMMYTLTNRTHHYRFWPVSTNLVGSAEYDIMQDIHTDDDAAYLSLQDWTAQKDRSRSALGVPEVTSYNERNHFAYFGVTDLPNTQAFFMIFKKTMTVNLT